MEFKAIAAEQQLTGGSGDWAGLQGSEIDQTQTQTRTHKMEGVRDGERVEKCKFG